MSLTEETSSPGFEKMQCKLWRTRDADKISQPHRTHEYLNCFFFNLLFTEIVTTFYFSLQFETEEILNYFPRDRIAIIHNTNRNAALMLFALRIMACSNC